MQHKVDACGDAGARVSLAVLNVETIFENSGSWSDRTELIVAQVVRGAGVSVEKTSAGSDQGSSAYRDQLVAGTHGGLQPGHNGFLRDFVIR